MSYLGTKHKTVLEQERAVFASPWLVNHMQGKYRGFHGAKNKMAFSWGDSIKKYVVSSGSEWLEDVDTVYVPMIWAAEHWVGLAIHLKLWVVEILDPFPSHYADRKVTSYMEPVVKMLPYIIDKFCKPHASQSHGLKPFVSRRVEGLYENSRTGDCGPVAVKFLEIHANGRVDDDCSRINDEMVDIFRKQYAMDIYVELVVPLYQS